MPARIVRACRRTLSLVALAVALTVGVGSPLSSRSLPSPEELEGRAPTAEELQPSVEAAFARESYAPGATASLVFFNPAPGRRRCGSSVPARSTPAPSATARCEGVPVTAPERIGLGRKGRAVRVARSATGRAVSTSRGSRLADGRVGFAPFVVRPRRLGEHRVAVVLPTMTWQAYNLRDDDGDGKGDSWYARWNVHTARLGRPFLNRGVPYNFRRYDLPFLHWLAWTGRQVDVLSDADLDSVPNARELRDAYDLIVFPGHHEYVTTHEYDVVERLPRPRRQPRVPLREQLLLAGRQARRPDGEDGAVARPRPARGGPDRRPVPRQRPRRAPRRLDRARAVGGALALRRHRLEDGSTFGEGGIEIDGTGGLAAGRAGSRRDPRPLRPGVHRPDDLLRDAAGAKVFAAGAFRSSGRSWTTRS